MDNKLAEQILSTLQGFRNEIDYLGSNLAKEVLTDEDITVLDTVLDMLDDIENSVKSILLPHRLTEINGNIKYYIARLKDHLDKQQAELFFYDYKYHFSSLFKILQFEVAYLVESYVEKTNYPSFYPESVAIDHQAIVEAGKNRAHKVSIVLLAYNNLEYTKECLESILQHTDDVDYELILVNNGSTDATQAYFESIPGAKVIYLKYNIHLVKGFNIGLMAAEGKYSAAVCNDFIFTTNWLSNLIACIETDSNIGFVAPGATNISNHQQIDVPFHSKEEFQELARAYNKSDPSKWQERVVLLPNVLCCPVALLESVGYYDTRFYRGEFLDDDISFRIRRAGYKLIFCADTITHHYGSITTTSDHAAHSLSEGRNIFFRKYGLDAWQDARIDRKYFFIDHALILGRKKILGIDVKCGATILQLKNKMWTVNGSMPKLSIYTSDAKYVQDCKSITDDVTLFQHFSDISQHSTDLFDFVYIERPLDEYTDELHSLFQLISRLMAPGGALIFAVNNAMSLNRLYELLSGVPAIHNRKIYLWDQIVKEAEAHRFKCYSMAPVPSYSTPEQIEAMDNLAKLISVNDIAARVRVKENMAASYGMFQMTFMD